MSFISKWFKKRTTETDNTVKVTKEMFDALYHEMNEKYEMDYIEIKTKRGNPTIFESKFGGLPYLGETQTVPQDAEGNALKLLAQINLKDLPINPLKLPETGLLQFWIANNDMLGLSFSERDVANGHYVHYVKDVDTTVSEKDVLEKYVPVSDEDYFPINGTLSLEFNQAKATLPLYMEEMYNAVIQTWNTKFPESAIKDVEELGPYYEEALDASFSVGSKMGGYPFFTQYDPRTHDSPETELLLQIDTDEHIMWGDSGVANFFISKEDIEQLNFADVLYNWDCY